MDTITNRKICARVVSFLCILLTIFSNNPTNTFAGKHSDQIKSITDSNVHVNRTLNFNDDRQLAQEWAQTTYRRWLSILSPQEKQAINDYTGADYHYINPYLRETKGELLVGGLLNEKIKLIDKALKKTKTSEKIVVYRRVTAEAFGEEFHDLRVGNVIQMEVARKLAEKIINKTQKNHNYLSTSLVRSTWSSSIPILMCITVPKKTHAGYIRSTSHMPAEMELLIARGYELYFDSISTINEDGREILKIGALLKQ